MNKIDITFGGPKGSGSMGITPAVVETLKLEEGVTYPATRVDEVLAFEFYLMLERSHDGGEHPPIYVIQPGGATTITPAQAAALGGVTHGKHLSQAQTIAVAMLRLCDIIHRRHLKEADG